MLASLEKSFLMLRCRMYSSSSRKAQLRFKKKTLGTLEPVGVQSPAANKFHKQKYNRELLNEAMDELKGKIDQCGETDTPNPDLLSKTFGDYVNDEEQNQEKGKRWKMLRKHFMHLEPKQVSVLTWSEKENIRYLVETDPEQWTPEAISQAYPVSPEELQRILKSKRKFSTLNDVIRHDQGVLRNIEKLKSGEIPMTDELAQKLKIRELIPLKVGELGMNAKDVFIRTEPDRSGEFAQLVAPPPRNEPRNKNTGDQYTAVVNQLSDGDIYDPSQPPPNGMQTMTKRELMKILKRNKLMTFSDFERKISQEGPQKLPEDMKYMLSLNETTNSSSTVQEESLKLNADEVAEGVSFSNTSFPSKQHRLKIPAETGEVVMNLEGQDAYIYHPETGTQRPYNAASNTIAAKITIPDEEYRPGAIYKVNDCYYDDQGEFLYRVV